MFWEYLAGCALVADAPPPLQTGCWLAKVKRLAREDDVRVTTALCATRRHESSGDERAPSSGCRSSPDEAGGSLTPEARARAGAAAMKARRAGTTRRPSAR